MSISKSRLLVSGFAVAGLCGAVALGYAAPYLGRAFLPAHSQQAEHEAPAASVMQVADRHGDTGVPAPATKVTVGRNVDIAAPHAQVKVATDSGKVAVKAPFTNVRVDPDRGQVRVRAPYVNLDIRW